MKGTTFRFFVHEEDLPKFGDLAKVQQPSEAMPGLIEISGKEIFPKPFLADPELKDVPYFGMHGSQRGEYDAQLVAHVGGDKGVFTHPCSEQGHLSMLATDPWGTVSTSISVPSFTMQFLIVTRNLVRRMLFEAGQRMQARLEKLEKEHRPQEASEEVKEESG